MAGIAGSGCGGPIGNQHALGNEGKPCKFNKDEEFKKFLEWAKSENALVLRMFAPYRGYSHDTLERWAKENEEYCTIYNMAKSLVGARRELRLIEANNARPFERYATFYDQALHEHEKRDLEHKAKIASESESNEDKEIIFKVVRERGRPRISTETVSE